MRRTIYQQGVPNTFWGIWDSRECKFVSGICEETPMLAVARLFQRLGDQAKNGLYSPRMLPKKEAK